MSARVALLIAARAGLLSAPLAGVSVHTGSLPATVNLKTTAAAVLGTDDTAAESATVSAKRLGATDVVLTARTYAEGDAALTRARTAADALAARWLDTEAHPLAPVGFTVLSARLSLARPLPVGDPASAVRGEIVSVRFTLTPAS